jgi:hypothetical protein
MNHKHIRGAQSLARQNISRDVWYYEEGRHLTFVVRRSLLKNGDEAVQFKVPLHRLEKSLARSPKRSR